MPVIMDRQAIFWTSLSTKLEILVAFVQKIALYSLKDCAVKYSGKKMVIHLQESQKIPKS